MRYRILYRLGQLSHAPCATVRLNVSRSSHRLSQISIQKILQRPDKCCKSLRSANTSRCLQLSPDGCRLQSLPHQLTQTGCGNLHPGNDGVSSSQQVDFSVGPGNQQSPWPKPEPRPDAICVLRRDRHNQILASPRNPEEQRLARGHPEYGQVSGKNGSKSP